MKKYITIFLFSLCILNFYPQVGINTENPLGTLHVVPKGNDDVLILQNIKTVSDPVNNIDGSQTNYHDLKISKSGVIRREDPSPKSRILTLSENITVEAGNDVSQGGSTLIWQTEDNTKSKDVLIEEVGNYVFAIRLYGSTMQIKRGTIHYVSLWKVGPPSTRDILLDVAHIFVISQGMIDASQPVASYSISLAGALSVGDKVYVKISYQPGFDEIGWTLLQGSPGQANKTSLLYWKI